MVAINKNTRAVIKGYLEGFIQGLIDEYKGRNSLRPTTATEYLSRYSSNGELKPFQAALIPPELIRINQFERGLSTKLGNSFEECARLIALQHHQKVYRGYDINTEVSSAAFAEAELQKQNYESAVKGEKEKPSFEQMVTAVLNARRNDDLAKKIVRVDLYIVGKDGTEFCFEIKAPKPNKGQCLEVLQRLLRFHLLLGLNRPQLQAYYAMPYNPYGVNKSDYKWTHAKSYLPFDDAVVIGNDFWSTVGGNTAYEELLEIYLEVGREKGKYMLDNLAFGF
ncbi:TdeIII family type II restriction endonuclease [Nodularia sp. UHCC 0506]|uniref:TdeIII family type II restriction endonuclease n=1 Tax=Nodularia sp. UHCC 0506 TaxID=3110243 RepID=UPI002B21700C|nr:TdeIII family type II restriction endonuclease [Nodularia sp. UHCC 0506]MEA5512495.1 TdeIII family type II restriction endonuclease [Nodularia sp. UHCC 0506]